jgi:hypothetical protein
MAQPTSANDLWDALYKWKNRNADTKTYYQPELTSARWRLVDEDATTLFPELVDKRGEVLGIDERFPNAMNGEPLPAVPEAATAYIISTQTAILTELYLDYVGGARADAEQAAHNKPQKTKKRQAAQKAFDDRQRELDRRLRDRSGAKLEPEYGREGGFGRQALKTCQDTAQANLAEQVKQWVSVVRQ